MATSTSTPVNRTSSFQAKHALFVVLGLSTLFVIYHNERFIIDHQSADWKYFFPVRWWLLFHGLGGTVALFLGPLQFSTRLRQRHLRVHRIIGRCYLGGVAISAPMAIYLTMIHDPLSLQVPTVLQATSWLLATALAFICIRKGKVPQHRQWMMRSYATTLIFVEVRVLDAIPALARMGLDSLVPIIWICNVLAWMVPTLIQQWPDIFGRKTALQRNAA